MLHAETVSSGTLDLLREIQVIPNMANMRLVGGTALALHIGHRKSIDLDLFGEFDGMVSFRAILRAAGHSADGAETGAVQSLRVDGVKVDFVNYPYPWLQLTYFDDAEDDPMPEMLEPTIWKDVKREIEVKVREFTRML